MNTLALPPKQCSCFRKGNIEADFYVHQKEKQLNRMAIFVKEDEKKLLSLHVF